MKFCNLCLIKDDYITYLLSNSKIQNCFNCHLQHLKESQIFIDSIFCEILCINNKKYSDIFDMLSCLFNMLIPNLQE